jgi:hypothetical protein
LLHNTIAIGSQPLACLKSIDESWDNILCESTTIVYEMEYFLQKDTF